jgi:diketogulonate reductase-like aldo/keto reductase
VRMVPLPSGETVSVIGQGTWQMGEKEATRAQEIAALRRGIDLGMTLIDTAEIYAGGGAESVVGEAIAGRREEVFIVSKVHPLNATAAGTVAACEASLRRIGTDRLDLYLLHWREGTALEETFGAFEVLERQGKIRHWGVSCFDVLDVEEGWEWQGGSTMAANQVLYNLTKRGIELNLLPLCLERALPIMAYSPVGQGSLAANGVVTAVAASRGVTAAQIALAWVLRQPGLLAIPKASSLDHVRQNADAAEIILSAEELATLDGAFPAPTTPQVLEIFQ